MNEEQLEDLKRFIDSKISQSEANTSEKLEAIRKEVQEGFSGVGDAVEEINKQVDERLTKLEQSA